VLLYGALLKKITVRFENLIAVAMKNAFFWDGLQHSLDVPEERVAFVFQKTGAAIFFETLKYCQVADKYVVFLGGNKISLYYAEIRPI
jgi:hypothetical protein